MIRRSRGHGQCHWSRDQFVTKYSLKIVLGTAGYTTHLGDVQQLMPEAGCGQVKAAGHRDGLPICKDHIAALEEALLVLLVDE